MKPSSQSSVPLARARARGRLEDIVFCVVATRWECMGFSCGKTDLCRSRSASDGNAVFFGNDEGGDSRPNLDGIDAATGPCLAMYEIP